MPDDTPASAGDRRLASLEARLARIEAHLGLGAASADSPPSAATAAVPPAVAAPSGAAAAPVQGADDLEIEVGQNWFARVGILVLAIGGGYMLTLPWAGLPAVLPALAGLVTAGALLFLAHRGERSFELVASHLRGAGMALLFCATLRLFFFGSPPALSIDSPAAGLVLAAAVAGNLIIALRRNSPWLTGLAVLTGCAAILAVGSASRVLALLLVLSACVIWVSVRRRWPLLAMASLGLLLVTYLVWAAGNPVRGGAYHFVSSPVVAPLYPLLCLVGFGMLPLLRPPGAGDDLVASANAVVTCLLGYVVFLVHTAAAFPGLFAAAHTLASLVLIGLAVIFWIRQHSRISTFFYAMTGYGALSLAIIKLAPTPDVFVWLSLQSVGVITTAIWFRSRSIVVANCLIYVAVVLAYMFLKQGETGISLVFGVVALFSARILNWQKHRLELQTELMRNAYLLCAFAVFPYALYHLVPAKAAGLAWTGMAVVYYVLNFVVRNRKYRWMGHGTLLLTVAYLLVAGRRLPPAWLVASFLFVGAVLLVVSLTFTHLRRREHPSSH